MASAAKDSTRIVSASLVLIVLAEIDCQNVQAWTEVGFRVFWWWFKSITLSMTTASPALGNMVYIWKGSPQCPPRK